MSRYLVKLKSSDDDAFAWVTPDGEQVFSAPNKAFWVSEEEKDILEHNLSAFLVIIKSDDE